MNNGRSLTSLAQELERQQQTKKDYLADSTAIKMDTQARENGQDITVFAGLNGSPKPLTEFAHGQVASALDIPKKYYDRMREESPRLLVENVNQWLHSQPKKKLIRTLDGYVRGFLSDRYRPLDNFDMTENVLPIIQEKGALVVSAELTDRRMYIKAILPSLSMTVQGSKMSDTRGMSVGDVVRGGVVISNSEIGAGSLKVEPFIDRLACLNGLIVSDSTLKKYHVGRGHEGGEEVFELFTDATRKADDTAFWLKVRDVVRGAFNQEIFEKIVHRMTQATSIMIENSNIPEVVELVAKRFTLPEASQSSILKHLIEGGDLSQWGLINAVTATANHTEDYELATELERAGGKILELAPTDWKAIAA